MRTVCDVAVNLESRLYLARFRNRNRILADAIASRTNNRCFIVGNGPSLNVSDLDKLAGEDCFAANHIYKLYKNTIWKPKYYIIQDRYTKLDVPLSEIGSSFIFAGAYYLCNNSIDRPSNLYAYYGRRQLNRGADILDFSLDISRYISVAYTVTYTAIQIAAYLGYKEIYLLGIDHKYSVETDDFGKVIAENRVRNHAYADVNKEVAANVIGMERAYTSARVYSEISGHFKIMNATRGGKLEVFPRVDFDSLF